MKEQKKKLETKKWIYLMIIAGVLGLISGGILFMRPSSFQDRTMGQALFHNISVENRITFFYLGIYLAVPLFLFAAYHFYRQVIKTLSTEKKKNLQVLLSLVLIDGLIFGLTILKAKKITIWSSVVVLSITFLWLFFCYSKDKKTLDLEKLKWAFLAAFPLTMPASLLVDKIIGGGLLIQ